MIERILWTTGSLPLIILGGIHLFYTFFTRKFFVRDEQITQAMRTSFPVLTRSTTMWKAWIGFNASHSTGAIYIGLINLFVAVRHFTLLQEPLFLLLNGIAILFYLWLAKKYWFKVPFVGILLTAICYIIAIIVIVCE